MIQVIITEYEKMYFSDKEKEVKDDRGWHIPRRLLEKLRRFDEVHCRTARVAVFDWSARDYAKATSLVGIIQIPGLMVEILPKIDKEQMQHELPDGHENHNLLAQHNLLYMLSLARKIPITEREIASLGSKKMHMLEVLIKAYTKCLMDELRRGVDHSYVCCEENMPRVKGKILMNRHLVNNAAHQERFYVGFDEFLEDTPLNRILKATCRRLVSMSSVNGTQRLLMEAVAIFDEVDDVIPDAHHFQQVHLHRNNDRFRMLLDFCRMVWQGQSPNPVSGVNQTFSILFPMERLFEEFIANYIRRYAEELGLGRDEVIIQADNHSKYLVLDKNGSKRFKLKPDLMIKNKKEFKLVLDTKWKCLKPDEEDRKNGVSQADMYQMFAYAKQYGCRDVVLLYPDNGEATQKRYMISNDINNDINEQIRIETVKLNLDLMKCADAFKGYINEILIGDGNQETYEHV